MRFIASCSRVIELVIFVLMGREHGRTEIAELLYLEKGPDTSMTFFFFFTRFTSKISLLQMFPGCLTAWVGSSHCAEVVDPQCLEKGIRCVEIHPNL